MKSVVRPIGGLDGVVLIFISLLLLSTTCSKHKVSEIRLESDHFTVIGASPESSLDEARIVLSHAEQMRVRFSELLGDRFDPQQRIIIHLEGPYIEQGPYFDFDGVHLFRYSDEEKGYLALLTHELSHAFRKPYYIQHDPGRWKIFAYYDEGFAEYLAQLVEPTKTGFPFYGFPEDVVAGSMVIEGNHIPQNTLRDLHHLINDSCNIQTYVLRASWCRFIHERFGWDMLLDIMYSTDKPTYTVLNQKLGEELPTVDSLWMDWTTDRFHQYENAQDIARDFQERTAWYRYCQF